MKQKYFLFGLLFLSLSQIFSQSKLTAAVPESEYQALVDFYTSLNGDNWIRKWDVSQNNLHEHPWNGVTVKNGHVVKLDLQLNNLRGKVPQSIKNLTQLQTLNLSGFLPQGIPDSFQPEDDGVQKEHDLNGTDLNVFSSLLKLKELNLDGCNLVGVVPQSFENLKTLTNLSLQFNHLTEIRAKLSENTFLSIDNQFFEIKELTYLGENVVIDKSNFPKIVTYNKQKQDYSSELYFDLLMKNKVPARFDNQEQIHVKENGDLVIPKSFLFSLSKDDKVTLNVYGDFGGIQTSFDFNTIKINLPKVADQEYQALIDFYKALGGENWIHKWNISTNNLDKGPWHGLTLENGHIIAIDLYRNNLKGAIPASIGNLKYLKRLSLNNTKENLISATPVESSAPDNSIHDLSTTDLNNLASLQNLEVLSLNNCKIKGAIPSSFDKLINLKILELKQNYISDIKASFSDNLSIDLSNQTLVIKQVKVKPGEEIVISYNDLPKVTKYNRGNFSFKPEFSFFNSNVEGNANQIKVKENGDLVLLDWQIPFLKSGGFFKQKGGISYGSTLKVEKVLVDLPAVSDSEYKALVDLFNALNGNNWLNTWDVSSNSLNTELWGGVVTENGHVVSINLHNNNIKGKIPASIQNLKYLKEFDLSGSPENVRLNSEGVLLEHDLSATDLNILSGLQNLENLNLGFCNLKGSIPKSFEKLVKVKELDLDGNHFSDIQAVFPSEVNLYIDDQIVEFSELTYTGNDVIIKAADLPKIAKYKRATNDFSINPVFSLEINYVKKGQFGLNEKGDLVLPKSAFLFLDKEDEVCLKIQNQNIWGSAIKFKDVSVNLQAIPNAEYQALVDLYNATEGSNWLQKWDVSKNNVHEGWFGVAVQSGHVVALNLRKNRLKGALPDSFKNLKYLQVLDLSGESFYIPDPDNGGEFPVEGLTTYPGEDSVKFSNDLYGTDLNILSSLSNLEVINLSKANLNGVIPKSLEKLTKLVEVDLSKNSFNTINALFPKSVTLYLDEQTINFEEFVYEGKDVSVSKLPNILLYNRDKNDFSLQSKFELFIKKTQKEDYFDNVGTVQFDNNNLLISNDYLKDLTAESELYLNSVEGVASYSKLVFKGFKVQETVVNDQTLISDAEYKALFYFFTTLHGESWKTKWDVTTNDIHLNKWHGVTIENGHIVGLDLTDNNLQGEVPDVFADLPYLKTLHLSANKISGIAALSSLKNVDLKIDSQYFDMGKVDFTDSLIIKDHLINRYDLDFQESSKQRYSLTINGKSEFLEIPKSGLNLTKAVKEWKVKKGDKIVLTQLSGKAIYSKFVYEVDFKKGDANLDGKINVLDLQTILNKSTGRSVDAFNFYASDLNKDGKISLPDVVKEVSLVQAVRPFGGVIEDSDVLADQIKEARVHVGMSGNKLILDAKQEKISCFEIKLNSISGATITQQLTQLGFYVYFKQINNDLSIIAYSLNRALTGKNVLAKINKSGVKITATMMVGLDAKKITSRVVKFNASDIVEGPKDTDVIVKDPKTKILIKNYPNPFINKTIISFLSDFEESNAVFSLYNRMGFKISQKMVNIRKGLNKYKFYKGTLKSGVYSYSITFKRSRRVVRGKMIIK